MLIYQWQLSLIHWHCNIDFNKKWNYFINILSIAYKRTKHVLLVTYRFWKTSVLMVFIRDNWTWVLSDKINTLCLLHCLACMSQSYKGKIVTKTVKIDVLYRVLVKGYWQVSAAHFHPVFWDILTIRELIHHTINEVYQSTILQHSIYT